jgi:hypothetical protein
MSGAAPDLVAGYLADLYAGLRVPAAEAELILAEAEDHLRETAAAGLAIGMTELEAQQSAVSSFGPVRAVVRAHRRRTVTAGGAAMAAWKLAALLATTVGAGGLAGMGIFAFLLRSAPAGPGPVPTVLVVYAAMAAGGLVLLAARRLARRGTSGRDPLSPEVTASCFLLASVLLGIFGFLLRSAPAAPPGPPALSCPYSCNWSSGPAAGPGPALTVLVVYAAMAAGGLVLLAARRLARRGTPGRDPLSQRMTTSCFLLASAPLFALIVKGVTVPIAPMITVSWLTPVSEGSVSAAPLVSGAVVAGCLAVAAGYGVQTALRRARRGPALCRVLGRADRGGVGRAYV